MKERAGKSAVIVMIMTMVLMLMMLPQSASAASGSPGKVKISSMTVGEVSAKTNAAAVTVKWNKVSKASAYEVYVKHAADEKWSKYKTVGKSRKSLKIKNVSAGKLSVKVRAVRKIKSKTRRGKFSAIKSRFITSKWTLEKIVNSDVGKEELKKLNIELKKMGMAFSFKGNTITMKIDLTKLDQNLAGADLSSLSGSDIEELKGEIAKDGDMKKEGKKIVKSLKEVTGVKKPTVVFKFNNKGDYLFSVTFR